MTTLPSNDIKDLLLQLAAALMSSGLKVAVDPKRATVRAKHPAVIPDDNPVAKALAPGLVQTVALGAHDGTLGWYWQWSGETRDSSPEYQLLGPAEDIPAAAEKIARVLRLVDEPAGR